MPTDNSPLPVAVVTGAARGIGLATMRWFLANGHRVAMLDIDTKELAKAASEYRDDSRVLALPCDVSDPEQVQTAIAKVEADFGRIRLPEISGNVCFGGPKRNRLFMAASQSLYAVYTGTQGAAPS